MSVRGGGYLAGEVADPTDPDSPDGRARILNVPTRLRIVVIDRVSFRPVAATLSAPDGTWRVGYLNPLFNFTVIGFDDRGLQNAAIQDWVKPALPE